MKAGLGDETMGLGRWNRGVVIVKAGDGRETVRDGRCEGLEHQGEPGGGFLDKGRNSQGEGTLGVRCRQRSQRRSGDK